VGTLEWRSIRGCERNILQKLGGLLRLQHAFRGQGIINEFIGKFFGNVRGILSVPNQIEGIRLFIAHTNLSEMCFRLFYTQLSLT